MLELTYNRSEATLHIKSKRKEHYFIFSTYYKDGKNSGEFGGELLLRPSGRIIWDELIHFQFPIEVEMIVMKDESLKHYTFYEHELGRTLTLKKVEKMKLIDAINLIFDDPYSL